MKWQNDDIDHIILYRYHFVPMTIDLLAIAVIRWIALVTVHTDVNHCEIFHRSDVKSEIMKFS